MKKLFTILLLIFGSVSLFGQVFITELADPNNNAGMRYIELYNAGASAVDFTENSGWRIDKYTNGSATVSQTLSLTGTIPAGGFYIIATGAVDGDFLATYGVSPDQFDGSDNNVAGSNGDDNLELYDGNNTLIDQFGVPGEDGTGTTHEFEDGRAERKATVVTGNATWDVNEWNIDNDSGGGAGTQDAPADFDPGAWIGAPSGNDTDTEVYDTGSQPASVPFSSLLDTEGEAVDVFSMTIEDQGSGDGLPTHVTGITIKPHTTNTADWTDNIQGVTVNDGSSVTIGSPTITDTHIFIPITSGNLDVADGTSKNVTIGIYLNSSSITDGAVLSFMVDASNHSFTDDASGSDFSSTFLLGDFNSNDFTIAVIATELQFSSVPSSVGINQDFSATVSATDVNGNTDTDDATAVTLSKKTGTGTLSSVTGLTQSLSSGTYTWSDLQFDTAGDFTVAANGGAYSEIVTGTITAANLVAPTNGDVFISEVADASAFNNEFLELYNNTSNTIDLTNTKVVRLTSAGADDGYVFDFSTDGTGDTQIPANGIIVIARGNDQASFESEWGALPGGVNFNQGNSNLYFGTGRQWAIKDGGTANTNDGTLIDETGEAVASSGNRSYQNPVGTWTSDAKANGTPGVLDGGQALPVELTSFTATSVDGGVVLNWTTATEVNNYGFEVEAEVAGNWTNVGFVEGHGNSNSPKDYSFFTSSNATSFRLKQVDTDGEFEYSDVVTVSGALAKTELLQNHPNPFNPSTQISFVLAKAGMVNVSVYNALGQKVTELVNGNMTAGTHNVQFNASNLSSGFYFYRLEAADYTQTMKMLLIK